MTGGEGKEDEGRGGEERGGGKGGEERRWGGRKGEGEETMLEWTQACTQGTQGQ